MLLECVKDGVAPSGQARKLQRNAVTAGSQVATCLESGTDTEKSSGHTGDDESDPRPVPAKKPRREYTARLSSNRPSINLKSVVLGKGFIMVCRKTAVFVLGVGEGRVQRAACLN